MNAIEIRELTKKYKDIVAVDRLSLEVREGELFALLGINGAGKSTTVKMLSCLCKPTGGDAYILGKSIICDGADIKQLIAVSPQETAVAGGLSVLENLQLICSINGFSEEKSSQKIAFVSQKLGLDSVMSRRASKLSGGWQRRLSIAMALISEPRILFLDEPTLGLDVIARSDLWDIIRGLKGSVTIVLTTHYMEEAEALSDMIGIMREGRLIACDTAENLKKRADTPTFEQAFIKIVKEGI